MIKLKPFRQTPGLCGPASLKMVMNYYGVSVSEKEIARVAGSTRERGTSIRGLIRAARRFGFKAIFRKDASLKDNEGISSLMAWLLGRKKPFNVFKTLRLLLKLFFCSRRCST